MTCYIIPALAAIVHYNLRKKNTAWKHDKYHGWLSLLFTGGALFGFVDHLWNGEIFLIGDSFLADIMLGMAITFVILSVWSIMMFADKRKHRQTSKISS